jgi:predicted DCC family thiol-disulfide oxidoreductase YuxK
MNYVERLKRAFGVDLRALALFRFGMGTLLMIDLLMRFDDIRGHYTNFGVMPVAGYVENFANQLHVSLHLANGGWGWILFLFAIHFVAAFCVAVGYRTRLATVVAWVLLVSLHNRNTYILNGGDVLFRCLYFFAMFLPMQARWSVDAALSPKKPSPDTNAYFGGPSIGIVLQICFVYLTTAMLKSGKEWWPDGTASYFALSLDEFTTPFGKWMLQWYELLRYSTYAVYALEWVVAFVILSPFFHTAARCFAVLSLWALHLNFDATMRLGIFPWVDIVGVSVLIPGSVFDWLQKRLDAQPGRSDLRIYYDGDCGFCRKAVLLLTEFLIIPKSQIEKCQDEPNATRLLADEHSWVVKDQSGTYFIRWDALVAVLRQAPLIFGKIFQKLPLKLLRIPGNLVYALIVRCRKSLGAFTARFLPERDASRVEPSTLVNLVTLFFIGYVALWNMKSVPSFGVEILPPWNKLASIVRIDQKWNMFAPYPLRTDGWYVMDGELRDGTKVDVLRRTIGQVSYDKPEVVAYMFKNARWRKFIMSLYEKNKKNHRLFYGRYLCRSWNEFEDDDKKLSKFQIYFMKEKNVLPGVESKVEKTMIWQHDCFKKKAEAGEES